MGFFNRKGKDPHAPAAAPRRERKRGHFEPYSMAKRPSFGQWLKYTWLDILTMIAMGAIGLGVSTSLPDSIHPSLRGPTNTHLGLRSRSRPVQILSRHLLRRRDCLPRVWLSSER